MYGKLEVANAKKSVKIPKLQKLTTKTGTQTQKQNQKSKKTPKLETKNWKVKKESSTSSAS